MEKRGQITIFIIIGLILLLATATIIYFYQTRVTAPIKKAVTVPEDVQQIYDYITTCTDQIGKDGLIIMGTQGGYIDVPPIIARNNNAYIAGDPMAISKTPLWYYEGEDRTPTLEFMQRELAKYVKDNLPACTGNFESFADKYKITQKSDILPVITFTDSEVIIEVKWQLDIDIQGRTTQLTEFISSFPVKLKPMWELAAKTMETENKEGWFENLTIDLMAANSKIPLSGMEFFCGTKKWHIRDVKQEIQLMLYYNLPFIRIDNTNYPPPLASLRTYNNLKEEAQDIREDLAADKEPKWPTDAPADVYEMNRMRLDVGTRKTDLKAAFTYLPDWPLFVNAQPNSGGILSTANMKGARKYLRFLCMNQWHFAYDLIYPIKMSVKDDEAFNGEGYTFQMGFPVIIEDNEESRIFFGLRKFIIPDMGTEFCQNFGTQSVDVRAKGFQEGSSVAEEIEGANITYRCVSQECQLGQTYSDGSGIIRLTAYLPEGCSNPTILAEKEGYLQGLAYANQELVEVQMTRLKKLPYAIMIHPYYEEVDKKNPTIFKNPRWLDAQSYTKFTKTMHATITITARNTTFDQYKLYPANATQFTTQEASPYELADASEVDKDEVQFIHDTAQYDIDILLFKGDQPIGGYHAENLTITYDEINSAGGVVFNVVEYTPSHNDDFDPAGMFLYLYERGEYPQGTPLKEGLTPTFT